MKLLVMSPSKSIQDETIMVTQMFEQGLKRFHLRKLNMSTADMKLYLDKIPKRFHNRIYLHTHHLLALRYNVKGIHLTDKHKKAKLKTRFNYQLIKMLRRPELTVTTSYSELEDLLSIKDSNAYEYVFLSPVFDSSDNGFQSAFSEYSLNAMLKKVDKTVIARGGVDIQHLQKSKDLGFDGIVFYRSIWKNENPVRMFVDAWKEFERLNIPVY